MCVDYRALNKLTIKNSYPLSRMDDIFDQLNGAKFFSKIDLRSGFHQVRLDAYSVSLTAFRTRYGHFEFRVLPFCLTNAPATFMSLTNNIFRDFLDCFFMVYLDDTLIYSKSWEEHLDHLNKVLTILRNEKFFGKLSKCVFGVTKVDYLGHIVTRNEIAVGPSKISVARNWPIPRNKTKTSQ